MGRFLFKRHTLKEMAKRIAVVGAGIAGLSCAYELKKAGFDVVVFEREDNVGGRMWTRSKGGLDFDIGANFLVSLYKNTHAYCDELGLSATWERMRPGKSHTFKQGRLCVLSLASIWSVLRFDSISFKSRIKMMWFFAKVGAKVSGLNFFDLSSAPEELDSDNAYSYARKEIGEDVAEYLIDGFTSTYQFHRADEISTTGMLALAGLMANSREGFNMCHTTGEMKTLPTALAKKLKVRTYCPVTKVESVEGKVKATAKGKTSEFDIVVLACTADVSKGVYLNPSIQQRSILQSVKYSSTINVSFKIPYGALDGISVVTVPYVENRCISEYTNEAQKGIGRDGKSLVNVGLHEGFAKGLMHKKDNEIFEAVKKELVQVCPPLNGDITKIENHDLQRWTTAMPKFDHKYVTLVKRFWNRGQGDNKVYLCGDYLNTPWIEGGITCGKKVAAMIFAEEKMRKTQR